VERRLISHASVGMGFPLFSDSINLKALGAESKSR
jgi:hypothetical protein